MPTPRRRRTTRPEAPRRSAPAEQPEERLQKTLARVGYGSRRACEELIREGRVRINGREATLGQRVRPSEDVVTVDGVPIPADPELRYLALNKPAGVTTTLRDAHAARSIAELLPPGPRVFPVGRLDRDTEGLLLLTNDGELANRLQHPRFGVEREYLAETSGEISRAAVRALTSGVVLEDGLARAVRVRVEERGRGRSAVSLVLTEGRKREVRRMLEAVGFPVRRLARVRVGPVRVGALSPGNVRDLSREEIEALYRATGLQRAAPRMAAGRRGAMLRDRHGA